MKSKLLATLLLTTTLAGCSMPTNIETPTENSTSVTAEESTTVQGNISIYTDIGEVMTSYTVENVGMSVKSAVAVADRDYYKTLFIQTKDGFIKHKGNTLIYKQQGIENKLDTYLKVHGENIPKTELLVSEVVKDATKDAKAELGVVVIYTLTGIPLAVYISEDIVDEGSFQDILNEIRIEGKKLKIYNAYVTVYPSHTFFME